MHHGTCVTHVTWCVSLIHDGGENVPGIPGACATRNCTYLARGPLVFCWSLGPILFWNFLWVTFVHSKWSYDFTLCRLLQKRLQSNQGCNKPVVHRWWWNTQIYFYSIAKTVTLICYTLFHNNVSNTQKKSQTVVCVAYEFVLHMNLCMNIHSWLVIFLEHACREAWPSLRPL